MVSKNNYPIRLLLLCFSSLFITSSNISLWSTESLSNSTGTESHTLSKKIENDHIEQAIKKENKEVIQRSNKIFEQFSQGDFSSWEELEAYLKKGHIKAEDIHVGKNNIDFSPFLAITKKITIKERILGVITTVLKENEKEAIKLIKKSFIQTVPSHFVCPQEV